MRKQTFLRIFPYNIFVYSSVSPFPSVCLFCVYSAACAACTYVLQLVLLGALIATLGRLEAHGLHGLFCYKLSEENTDNRVTSSPKVGVFFFFVLEEEEDLFVLKMSNLCKECI